MGLKPAFFALLLFSWLKPTAIDHLLQWALADGIKDQKNRASAPFIGQFLIQLSTMLSA